MGNKNFNPTQIIQNELVDQLDALKRTGEKNPEKYLDLARVASRKNKSLTQAFNLNIEVVNRRNLKSHRDIIRYVWDLNNPQSPISNISPGFN